MLERRGDRPEIDESLPLIVPSTILREGEADLVLPRSSGFRWDQYEVFSVVTVCFRAAPTLVGSVNRSQSEAHPDVEGIVIMARRPTARWPVCGHGLVTAATSPGHRP